MLFLEWSFPYNFVWHLPFQIHEKFQHLKAHNITSILHKNNIQAPIQCSTLSEIAWHCLQVPRLHQPTFLTKVVLGWIWVCSIGRMIRTGRTKYSEVNLSKCQCPAQFSDEPTQDWTLVSVISVQVTASVMAQLWSTKLMQIMGSRKHTFHLHTKTNCMMMYRNIIFYCKDHTKQIQCVVKCSILMKKQVTLGTVCTTLYMVMFIFLQWK